MTFIVTHFCVLTCAGVLGFRYPDGKSDAHGTSCLWGQIQRHWVGNCQAARSIGDGRRPCPLPLWIWVLVGWQGRYEVTFNVNMYCMYLYVSIHGMYYPSSSPWCGGTQCFSQVRRLCAVFRQEARGPWRSFWSTANAFTCETNNAKWKDLLEDRGRRAGAELLERSLLMRFLMSAHGQKICSFKSIVPKLHLIYVLQWTDVLTLFGHLLVKL